MPISLKQSFLENHSLSLSYYNLKFGIHLHPISDLLYPISKDTFFRLYFIIQNINSYMNQLSDESQKFNMRYSP